MKSDDPAVHARAFTATVGGAFLGFDPNTAWWVGAPAEQAVLVLGPPRSGKTSCVVIPAVASALGPVVSTSTKPEVMGVTGALRSRFGDVWHFDPAGSERTPAGARRLCWSPVPAASTWDRALLVARAMVTAAPAAAGTSSESHWSERAVALLAPLLHAAHLDGRPVGDVSGWVLGHDLTTAADILDDHGAGLAFEVLGSVDRTHERERSSIFSTSANVLAAYTSTAALAQANVPNFDPAEFVRSGDTIYITASAQHQALVAPLVVGLLEEIRHATFDAHRRGQLSAPVLFALDEVANIAPIANLPAIVSEAGGQGLQVMACFQDLSQARARWGTAAEGFLSLFGTKVILPGIGDTSTLNALSTLIGEWDRPVSTESTSDGWMTPRSYSTSWTTNRQPILSAGEIANLPPGRALHVVGTAWGTIALTPYYSAEPWPAVLATAPAEILPPVGGDQVVIDLTATEVGERTR